MTGLEGQTVEQLRLKAQLAGYCLAMLDESDDPRAPQATAHLRAQVAELEKELARREGVAVCEEKTKRVTVSEAPGGVVVRLRSLRLTGNTEVGNGRG